MEISGYPAGDNRMTHPPSAKAHRRSRTGGRIGREQIKQFGSYLLHGDYENICRQLAERETPDWLKQEKNRARPTRSPSQLRNRVKRDRRRIERLKRWFCQLRHTRALGHTASSR
jgi:hypothetical protein